MKADASPKLYVSIRVFEAPGDDDSRALFPLIGLFLGTIYNITIILLIFSSKILISVMHIKLPMRTIGSSQMQLVVVV